MPGPAASATNVGAGSPRGTSSPRAGGGGGGGGARQRKGAGSGRVAATRAGGTSSGGMWRFYTDDSPGIKVSSTDQLNHLADLLTLDLFSGRTRPCPRHVPPIHSLRLHAAHLGEIQQGLDRRQQGANHKTSDI